MSTQPPDNPEGPVDAAEEFVAEERANNFGSTSSGRRSDLDHGLREAAGVIAILVAAALYVVGFLVIVTAVWPSSPPAPFLDLKPQSQIAIIAALFTVPTVILLAVLKATNTSHDNEHGSVQEALGAYGMKILDKLSGSK